MISLSRTLSPPRRIERKISGSKDLAEILTESFWIDNLSQNEVESLKLRKIPLKEILIIDYFKKVKESVEEDIFNEEDRLELYSYLSLECNESESGRREFSTPLKCMASLSYESLVQNENLLGIARKSKSKDESKEIVFIDFILPYLTEKRRRKVEDSLEKTVAAMKRAATLYLFQKAEKKVREMNEEANKFIKDIEKVEITIGDLQRYQEIFSREAPNIPQENDEDYSDALKEREQIIEKGLALKKEKIEKKLESLEKRVLSIGIEFKKIEEKSIPESKDYDSSEEFIRELTEVSNFYRAIDHEDEISKSSIELRKRIEGLKSDYDEYKSGIKATERNIKKITNMISEFQYYLNASDIEGCKEVLKRAEKVHSSTLDYKNNKYLTQQSEQSAAEIRKFYREVKDKIDERRETLYIQAKNIENEIKEEGSMARIFIGPFKRTKLEKLKNRISQNEEISRLCPGYTE